MPGVVPRSRRASERDDDEDEDPQSSREITPLSDDDSPHKRVRLTNGERPNGRTNGQLLPDSYLTASTDEVEKHAPGAIVRIKVRNFVTYTAAEFHCGPSLNMIIGPNGTGKSTLVCAICLGLGWSPNCLGRAKEIGEFVKHGHDQAEIEIELAGGPRTKGRNQIIHRTIRREKNMSRWQINGSPSTQKAVMDLARSFRIQIDNLCQFLPQDRVVEFAALSPIQLLESTQRAAAPEQMTVWHQELKELAGKRSTRRNEQRTWQDQLTELQTRQNQQREEVDRMTERKSLQARLTGLHKARIPVRERAARADLEESQVAYQEAEEELLQLRQDRAPVLGRIDAKKRYCVQVEEHAKRKLGMTTRSTASCQQLKRDLDGYAADFAELRSTFESEGQAKIKATGDMKRIEQSIRTLETQLNNAPPEVDLESFKQRTTVVEDKKRKVNAEVRLKEQHLQQLKPQYRSKLEEQRVTELELKALATQSGQQMQKLRQGAPDAAKAWEWIENNKDRFEGRVYGPPAIECSVEDPRYADALETILGASDVLKVITVASSRDYRILQSHLFSQRHQDVHVRADPASGLPQDYRPGEKGLQLKDISIRNVRQGLSGWQPACSTEQLKSYGLDDWALGLLKGPEPVLSMLCESKKLHRTAVSLKGQSSDEYERVRQPESGVTSWIAGKEAYTITRRAEYGPGAETSTVIGVRPAKIWTDKLGDSGLEADRRRQLAELKGEAEELKREFEETKDAMQLQQKEVQALEAERQSIQKEKAELQKGRSAFDLLPGRIEKLKDQLAASQASIVESDDKRRQAREQEGDLAIRRGQKALDYSRAVELLRTSHVEHIQAAVWVIEAQSEVESLVAHNLEVENLIRTLTRDVEELGSRRDRLRQEVHNLRQQKRQVEREATADERNIIVEWTQGEQSLDDLEAEITATAGRIDLLHEGNPHAIQHFEKRQQKIEELTERIANHERDMETWDRQITEIRGHWEPQLEALVAKISDAFAHNFEQIGCAGQIGVYKDEEDFGQWAIHIEVKFRENEQLSLLDSHRQSGGERAVSTIFYLMALQSLTQSPFRVVDEINQGMDPRNERMVHERMVDIACAENTSQYFLITPKLLNGLKYHERMVVHTIYSGETMPEDNRGLDFGKLADIALRVLVR